MPKACSAINCPNRDTRENRAKGLSFHSFPKAHELRKKWMLAVNRVEPGSSKLWIPGSGACLCSAHFSQEEFEIYGGQKRLKAGVIPSMFSFKKPNNEQHPSKSLKTMGTSLPAVSIGEAASPDDPSQEQAKTVELIQAEHQYSLSEPVGGRTQPFFSAGTVLGSERKKETAHRRLSYYQQELWNVLESLREQHLLREDTEYLLRSQFSDLQLDLQCEGVQCETYSAATCNFAVSLHLFSAKAYKVMRRTFQMPEPTILRTWLSNLDYKPGFSQQAFSALAEGSKAGKQTFKSCSLLVGTMPLERRIRYDPFSKSLQGLVDFGAGSYDADEVPVAGEALLFVAVGFQGQWIAPLGYFLLATLQGNIQAQLLRHCILKLYDIDVQVISVTSDATAPNIDTARQLGVVVEGLAVKSTFSHPATPALEVAYFFDPCHLMSLIHNTLQANGSFQVSGKAVCWDYLVQLGALQEGEMLQAACRNGEINVHEQRIWGNGAVQLFSEGTAQALHFAARLGLPQFQGQETTAHFISLLSAVFDACTSWNVFGRGSKVPLSLANVDTLNNLCNEYENLLRKLLTATGELLVLSRRRWSFLGFLVNLRSLQWVVQTHLQVEANPVAYLLSCWWSLDPLEWCRGAIRQACGHKGAVTAWSFQDAYRLILESALSRLGVEPPNLLDISLCRRASLQLQASWPLGQRPIWQLPWYTSLRKEANRIVIVPALLAELEENTITYISCAIVEKLLPILPCAECRAALLSPCSAGPAGCALVCVESSRGKYLPAKSVQRVIHRAKQTVGLSSWFFRDSSPHGGLAQELAILADKLVRTFLKLCSGPPPRSQSIQLSQECHSKDLNYKQSIGFTNGSKRTWPQQPIELMEWYKVL